MLGDRGHHVRHPGGDDLRRQLGVGVLGAQADRRHHGVAVELGPELRLVLEHRRPPAPVLLPDLDRLEAGAGLLDEARLVQTRASAPPRRRFRATDDRRREAPRAGPRSGCGSRRPRCSVDCTKVVSERRVSCARASIVSSLTPSASSTTARPLPASGPLREDVQPGDPVGHAHMIAVALGVRRPA